MTTFHPDFANLAAPTEEELDAFLEQTIALLKHLYSADTLARFGVVLHGREDRE